MDHIQNTKRLIAKHLRFNDAEDNRQEVVRVLTEAKKPFRALSTRISHDIEKDIMVPFSDFLGAGDTKSATAALNALLKGVSRFNKNLENTKTESKKALETISKIGK